MPEHRKENTALWRKLPKPVMHAALAIVIAIFSVHMNPVVAQGSADQLYQEAQRILDGHDVFEALRLFRQAADQGHADSMARIGLILDGAEENLQALEWYTMAADAGSAEGMLWLSEMYYKGEASEPDSARGAQWLKQAADAGLASAQTRLANALEKGVMGFTVDAKSALDYWLKAALQENHNALLRMAAAYREGALGLDVDENEALKFEAKIQ